MIRSLIAVGMAGGLTSALGCSGTDKDTDPTVGAGATTGQNEDPKDSEGGGGPSFLEPEIMFFYLQFAVDDANTVIEANDGGSPIASYFGIILTDAAFSDFCYLDVDLVGQTNATWAAGLGAWYGVDAASDAAVVDCPSVDPSYDVAGAWAGAGTTFQAYISTAPDEDALAGVVDYYGVGEEVVLGAVVDNADILPYPDVSLAGFALELDDANALVLDASGYPVQLAVIDVPRADTGGGVNKALYLLNAWSGWYLP